MKLITKSLIASLLFVGLRVKIFSTKHTTNQQTNTSCFETEIQSPNGDADLLKKYFYFFREKEKYDNDFFYIKEVDPLNKFNGIGCKRAEYHYIIFHKVLGPLNDEDETMIFYKTIKEIPRFIQDKLDIYREVQKQNGYIRYINENSSVEKLNEYINDPVFDSHRENIAKKDKNAYLSDIKDVNNKIMLFILENGNNVVNKAREDLNQTYNKYQDDLNQTYNNYKKDLVQETKSIDSKKQTKKKFCSIQ